MKTTVTQTYREHLRAHGLQGVGDVRAAACVLDHLDRLQDVLLRRERVQVELDGSPVAEHDHADPGSVLGHLQRVDDRLHVVQHHREPVLPDTARGVDGDHDVRHAVASCNRDNGRASLQWNGHYGLVM